MDCYIDSNRQAFLWILWVTFEILSGPRQRNNRKIDFDSRFTMLSSDSQFPPRQEVLRIFRASIEICYPLRPAATPTVRFSRFGSHGSVTTVRFAKFRSHGSASGLHAPAQGPAQFRAVLFTRFGSHGSKWNRKSQIESQSNV